LTGFNLVQAPQMQVGKFCEPLLGQAASDSPRPSIRTKPLYISPRSVRLRHAVITAKIVIDRNAAWRVK
jgi:hypothetical protein